MRLLTPVLFVLSAVTSSLAVDEAHAVKGDLCNAKFMDQNGNLRPEKVSAYVMHEQFEIYRKADTNCDGHLSAAEIQKFESDQKLQAQIDLTQQYVKESTASGQRIPLDKDGEPPIPIVASLEPSPPACQTGWQFLLRNSQENIGVFSCSCPKDFKSATGAQFGYSRDGVVSNQSWTAKGVAAIAYSWVNPKSFAEPYVVGYGVSPWVSFNRLTNSLQSLKSKETDVLSYGGTGELALGQILNATHYLRAKAQLNSNFEGIQKSVSTAAEWQPVSNELGISAPNGLGPYLVWEIDPTARLIYSERRAGSQDPIFALRNNVVRAGPVFTLTVAPVANDLLVPKWLQAASLVATFEWLKDLNNRQSYRLLNTTINFPLDADSHLGIQLNYQYGDLEETDQKVNLATAGLSAKW